MRSILNAATKASGAAGLVVALVLLGPGVASAATVSPTSTTGHPPDWLPDWWWPDTPGCVSDEEWDQAYDYHQTHNDMYLLDVELIFEAIGRVKYHEYENLDKEYDLCDGSGTVLVSYIQDDNGRYWVSIMSRT